MTMKQSEIKKMVSQNRAIDFTKAGMKERKELMQKEGGYETIGVSIGVSGLTGMLMKGNTTGTLYAITQRATSLFIFG